MRKIILLCCVVFATCGPLRATNYTVKASGGSFTTMAACATQMSSNGTGVSDTCTVFAGTYSENVTVPAGSAGNYKIFNVNGSDVVTVLGFTLNSHTKLIGNCTAPAAINTCGFNIQNTSAPSSAKCVNLPNGVTDIYIRNNVMYACGAQAMVGVAGGDLQNVSFIYVQGNTLSYACITQAQAGTATKECNGIQLSGNHFLVENNDLSHYTLGIVFEQSNNAVFRKNTIHDQYETEAGGNAHTDAFYASTSTTTDRNVIEGNNQYTGVGPNAKGLLTQGEFSPCNGTCAHGVIFRFNVVRDLGSGNTSSYGYDALKIYNNTNVNLGNLCSSCFGGVDNFFTDLGHSMTNSSDINNIFYFPSAQTASGMGNPTAFDSASAATGTWGHNLAFCNVSGASNCALFGHVYEAGTWTADAGNILGYANQVPTNNPNFVNLAGNDFHLQVGSPAIGAGTFLTTVNGTIVSSTSLVVNDAAFFQDGYGLSNAYSTVNGDCIAVTTVSNHACVTSVNYSTKTLTLASSISATNGDPVWLWKDSSGTVQLTGVNPNIGAFQTVTPVPIATFTPASVNFGNVPAGLTSNPISVTLQNTGSANLVVSTVSLGSAVFSLINNTCGSPATITNTIPGTGFTLTPGASCTFQAIYQPAVPNFTNTASVFFSPGASNPDALSLTGNSTGPSAPSVINFAGNFTSSGTVVVK